MSADMPSHAATPAMGTARFSRRETLISTSAAFIGLLITVLLARLTLSAGTAPFLVASMGATAVLLFAASSSPMAQPWSVLGGHLVSAVIGITCATRIDDPALAAALAGGGAIAAMLLLRCLHPPGGATALMPVASPDIAELGYQYVLAPVGIDVLLLLGLGVLINHYLLRRPYPASHTAATALATSAAQPAGLPAHVDLDEADMAAALAETDSYIDATPADLVRLHRLARRQSLLRRLGERHCGELQTPLAQPLAFDTPLATAAHRLQQTTHEALPVVDRNGRVIGQCSLADLARAADTLPLPTRRQRLESLLTPTGTLHSDKPEVVGQIMQPPVVAQGATTLREALARFPSDGPALIAVVDVRNRLTGVMDLGELAPLSQARVAIPVSVRPASR